MTYIRATYIRVYVKMNLKMLPQDACNSDKKCISPLEDYDMHEAHQLTAFGRVQPKRAYLTRVTPKNFSVITS